MLTPLEQFDNYIKGWASTWGCGGIPFTEACACLAFLALEYESLLTDAQADCIKSRLAKYTGGCGC